MFNTYLTKKAANFCSSGLPLKIMSSHSRAKPNKNNA